MTVKEVFDLRSNGHTEEAYEAARKLYANSKDGYTSACMFWTAFDMLRLQVKERNAEEARRIYLALERLLSTMNDKDGKAHAALSQARQKMDNAKNAGEATPIAAHAQLGQWGEEMAAAYLRDKGYVILEHDWHSSHRDIDLVAIDGNMLVFVEVKTRSNNVFGNPEEAVGYQKQRRLLRSINHYLHYRHVSQPWRFDVIAVTGSMDSMPAINHIEDFPLSFRLVSR